MWSHDERSSRESAGKEREGESGWCADVQSHRHPVSPDPPTTTDTSSSPLPHPFVLLQTCSSILPPARDRYSIPNCHSSSVR